MGEGKRGPAHELFMKQVLELLREEEELEVITPNLKDFSVQVGSEEPGRTIYLQNFFQELRDVDPEERVERLRGKLRTMLEEDDEAPDWESVRAKLLGVVRPSTFAASLKHLGSRLLLRPLAPFLSSGVVIDYPAKMVSVMLDDLKKWGVDAETVFEQAAENLTELPSSFGRYGESEGVQYIVNDDSYEAARVTSPKFLRALSNAIGVRERLVVAIPHRSLLLATDAAIDGSVARLAETARREYDASPRHLSPALYTIDDGGRCQPYLREAPDAVRNAVGLGHRLLALSQYGEQKTNIDAAHEADETDIFVASYKLMSTHDVPWSYALWPDAHTWLPVADYVCFNRAKEEKLFFVSWHVARELVGELWRELPDVEPPRIEARQFPSDALYEELRKNAVDPPAP